MAILRSPMGSIATALVVLVTGPSFSSVAVAADLLEPSPTASPTEVAEVPAPEADTAPIPAETPSTDATVTAPEGDASVPEVQRPQALTPEEAANPEAPAPAEEAPAPAEATVADPPGPAPAEEAAIDPSLLDAEASDPLAPVATAPVRSTPSSAEGRSPEERDAAIEAAYANLYRPADNPLRLNVTGRMMFANVSGKERVNGRFGGAAVDIGPSWNRVGVAATLTGWGGRLQLPEDTGAEMNAMLGGGLTVGLGRLALQSRGFIDLRLGYDVFYGVVNQRSEAPPVVAPQSDPATIVATAENLLPHGPRVRMDLGLLGAGNRRFFHGLGFSIGYQALVGSFTGELPMANMLTLGFSYWMG